MNEVFEVWDLGLYRVQKVFRPAVIDLEKFSGVPRFRAAGTVQDMGYSLQRRLEARRFRERAFSNFYLR